MTASGNRHPAALSGPLQSHTIPVAILLFISFWTFFYNSGAVEIDNMEARNLVTAREMIRHDNWLIPTMNGEIRLAKPPLPTWLAALVSLPAGETRNLTALRIPNAISALLLTLFAYGLVWSMTRNRNQALMAAAVLATNYLMMKMGHRATWDIFCHTFMLGGLWAFTEGVRNNRGWPVFAIFGALMALSFMSKGPVAFFALLLPFILSYLWIFGIQSIRNRWKPILFAVAICLILSSLWPLYIWYYHPEALLATAHEESGAWIDLHVKPFWYYSNFMMFSGLWLVLTIAAFCKPFVERRVSSIPDYRFLLLWLALEVLLLSLIPEKKTRYLLPAMIPMALLAGALYSELVTRFAQGEQNRGDKLVIMLHGLLFSLTAIAFPIALFYRLESKGEIVQTSLILLSALVFPALLVAAWYLYKRKNLFALFLLTSLQFCFIASLYMHYYPEVGISNPEYRSMKPIDQSLVPEGMTIYLAHYQGSVKYIWGLDRRVTLWNSEGVKLQLMEGKTVAVISKGDPQEFLRNKIGAGFRLKNIDQFDYNKKRPQADKIFLYLVSQP